MTRLRVRRGVLGLGLLLLGIGASPLGAQERHGPDESLPAGGPSGGTEPSRPEIPAGSDLVRIELDRETRAAELIVGPTSLPAGGPHVRLPIQLIELPMAGWLHTYSWELRDSDGNLLPERLLHHVHVIDPDSRELFAPTPRRFIAAGRETDDVRLPKILGYPVDPHTRVLITTMFAPLPDETYEDVYLHLRVDYTPADDPGFVAPRNIYPLYIDVMGPVGEKSFELPPGTHQRSWEGRPATSGRILGLTAHLHDYADWIRLDDVTSGSVVWEAVPERDEDGRVTSVPMVRLWWRGGLAIRSDHTYRLTVQYTNPLDGPAPDAAMGVIGGIILGDPNAWPPLDRDDPAYVADLTNTLESPERSHEHAAGMDHAGMGGGERRP